MPHRNTSLLACLSVAGDRYILREQSRRVYRTWEGFCIIQEWSSLQSSLKPLRGVAYSRLSSWSGLSKLSTPCMQASRVVGLSKSAPGSCQNVHNALTQQCSSASQRQQGINPDHYVFCGQIRILMRG